MTNAEYLTCQFYTWEYRGRGWHLEDTPVYLEPPFIPFVRHIPQPEYIDDGKQHTWVSKAIEYIKGKERPKQEEVFELDYETIEQFPFNDGTGLTALQVKVPKERTTTPERMKALLIMLSSSQSPVSFEIIGNRREMVVQFVCRHHQTQNIESNINAYFPECTVVHTDTFLENVIIPHKPICLTDYGLKEEFVRPLAISKNFTIDPLTGLFGALESLQDDEHGGLQILFSGAVNSWTDSIIHSVTMPDGSSFFSNVPESPQLAFAKTASPLFGVCIRVFGQGRTFEDAQKVFEAIHHSILHASIGQTNSLIPLPTQEYDADTRIDDIYYRRSHRLGMILNADELVHLLHFPSANIQSQKLYSGNRKTAAVPAIAKNKAFSLGINTHNGTEEPVTTGIDERLKHTHIIGVTGTGKSTHIANLIIQDVANGLGLVLFDPHGDLVDDVIARIPENRRSDIVLIDPSDAEFPVGLNILQAHSDSEKEILSSDLVASFRRLSTSWGDQMNAVLGNAIMAMLESTEGGTLHDLRRFLVEKDFRNRYLQTVSDPSTLYYWHKTYPLLKTNSIGPILTRLDTFLRPRTIRNMVIQKTGLDFETLINSNKIILVKLPQGLIGTENSYFLGSLILSKIHQAAFARQSKTTRNPFFIYLDEFQNFITPSIIEMLSGVRKYNVGLILSHQGLQQLQHDDDELLHIVLGTYTKIVFRVSEPDAKKLKDGFASFDVIDLQNLGRGEAVIRIEQPQYDCSLDTIPLSHIDKEIQERSIESVIAHSRSLYAKERREVEKLLADTLSFDIEHTETIVTRKEEKGPTQEDIPQSAFVPREIPKSVITSKQEPVPEADISTHRYLQTLVKKMAEARGYTATLEVATPDHSGSVDVLLSKDNRTIAIEICNTTDAEWEMHNIEKCVTAGYTTVISLCGDPKQLEKIKQKCISELPSFESTDVRFFTPDAFFSYLDQVSQPDVSTEVTIKGYRVNVTYDSITPEEMTKKRASVAQVVLNAMKRSKKKP